MTATSISLNKYELIASICRDSFEEFVRRFWHCVPGAGKLKWNWHLGLFCEEFQAIAERVFRLEPKEHDAVFNEPPGTSKSTVFSILGPAWCWTRMPSCRILTASHTDTLVLDLSNKSRQVIKSELYRKCFPEIVFREDQDSKGYYGNTLGGDRLTCTVAGKSPTGFHAHIIIIDDPIDPKKALSEASVAEAKEFITNVIPTRKVDKIVTPTLLVMQRLGLGDPTDVMMTEAKKEGAAKVHRVCLPAELIRGDDGAFIETDVIPQALAKRYVDGLLDPDRLGPIAIAEAKARGAHHYNTQFLQRPFNKEGGMFLAKFFNRRVKAAPFKAKRVNYVDRAATEGAGCNTVATCMASDGESYYVGPVLVGQWETYERDDQLLTFANKLRTRFGDGSNEPTHVIEHEPGSSGVDAYKHTARKLAGFKVQPDRPTGEKVVRAEPFASQCAAGSVVIVDDGTWDVQAWIDELCAFPHGQLLDRPDSASGAFNWLIGRTRKNGMDVVQSRTIRLGKREGPRILFMDAVEASQVIIEEPTLLVHILLPGREEEIPHGLNKCLGQVSIQFADVDPADHQQSWDSSVPPFGLPCEKIMAKPEHAKAMWECLLKSHSPSKPEAIVVVDDTDGKRAQSAAMAICDAMGLPRPMHLSRPDEAWVAGKTDSPPNRHVYETLKKGRWSVSGR